MEPTSKVFNHKTCWIAMTHDDHFLSNDITNLKRENLVLKPAKKLSVLLLCEAE